jgi:hypothetical protein
LISLTTASLVQRAFILFVWAISNMKGAIFAAAAMVGSAMADGVHRRHDAFHQRREASSMMSSSIIATPSAPALEEET